MSLIDWNFESEFDVELDTVIYKTAPSSLKAHIPIQLDMSTSRCVREGCQHVKEGRIDFHYRSASPGDTIGGLLFHLKDAPPQIGSNGCFFLRDGDDFWKIGWWDGLNMTDIGEWATEGGPGVFRHLRLSWWEESSQVICRLEKETGGIWCLCDPDVNTLINPNNLEAYHGVGLMISQWSVDINYVWFDDVKIERLVSSL